MRRFLGTVLALTSLTLGVNAAGPMFRHSDTDSGNTGIGGLVVPQNRPQQPQPSGRRIYRGIGITEGAAELPAAGQTPEQQPSPAPSDTEEKASIQREFEQLYHDNSFPKISTGTAQNFTIINASVTRANFSDGTVQTTASKVLQTGYATSTSATSTTSTSYADTALSVTITPKSASSKIVIWVKTYAFINLNGAGIIYGIARNGTDLVAAGIAQTTMAVLGRAPVPVSFVYQDSPASTSALTYMLRVKSNSAGNDVRDNIDTLLTSMYVEEVQ